MKDIVLNVLRDMIEKGGKKNYFYNLSRSRDREAIADKIVMALKSNGRYEEWGEVELSRSLHAPHGSEMEELDYIEKNERREVI